MIEDFLKIIETEDLPDVGPYQRDSAKSIEKLNAEIESLNLRASRIGLVRSAAFLWHDHLDASHDISQDLSSADGSFLHGIMHRREPDYPNAKYWFRCAGDHSSYSTLASRVEEYLGEVDKGALSELLVPGGCWDPFAFVDAVETAERMGENINILQNIQRLEFESLVEAFLV